MTPAPTPPRRRKERRSKAEEMIWFGMRGPRSCRGTGCCVAGDGTDGAFRRRFEPVTITVCPVDRCAGPPSG